MANRFEISTIFKAVDKMTAPISRMQKSVRGLVTSSQKGLSFFNGIGGKITNAIGYGGVLSFAGLTAAITSAIKVGMEFDQTMVSAAAKLDIKKGTKQFEELRAVVMDVGSKTEFSSSQVADALDNIAAAGFNAQQAMVGLPAIIDLASAAGVNLASATTMAADTLGAFALKSNDTKVIVKNLNRVNDVMAMTANITTASMEDIYSTFRQAGPQGVLAGASLETVAAMAGTMADAGIKADLAGTAIKNFFLQLSNPKGATAKTIKALGLRLTDKKGSLKDIPDLIDEINKKTAKLSKTGRQKAFENLFGREGLSGNAKLITMGGEAFRKLRKDLENANGYGKELANTMRNTLRGSVNSLTSSIENMSIELFNTTEGPLKEVIDGMTKWVRANGKIMAQKFGQFLIDTYHWLEKWSTAIKWVLGIVAALWSLSVVLKLINLLMMTNPIVLIITAIVVAVGALVYAIYSYRKEIVQFFKDMWAGVQKFKKEFIEFKDNFKKLTFDVAKKIADHVSKVMGAIVDAVTAGFTSFIDYIMDKITSVVGFVKNAWSFIAGSDAQGGAYGQDNTYESYGIPMVTPQYRLASEGGNPAGGSTNKTEVVIRDETTNSTVTQSGPAVPGVKVQKTGGFTK